MTDRRLVRREDREIRLFDPPFDKSSLNPGYIKGYVPGVRENGGQYTHAAIWTVMAFAAMSDSDRAWELFALINPVLHASTPTDISVYKVEPYVVAADVYGAGEADSVLGRAIAGRPREEMCIVGAVGHDFYEGERDGPKGFPRFTDPGLRGPSAYAGYLRMATERSLERCGIDGFDLLLLHNPDRIGYTSEAVWEGMSALRDAPASATRIAPSCAVKAAPNGPISTAAANAAFPTSVLAAASAMMLMLVL